MVANRTVVDAVFHVPKSMVGYTFPILAAAGMESNMAYGQVARAQERVFHQPELDIHVPFSYPIVEILSSIPMPAHVADMDMVFQTSTLGNSVV